MSRRYHYEDGTPARRVSVDYWTGEPEPPLYACVDDGRIWHEGTDELEACEGCKPVEPIDDGDYYCHRLDRACSGRACWVCETNETETE